MNQYAVYTALGGLIFHAGFLAFKFIENHYFQKQIYQPESMFELIEKNPQKIIIPKYTQTQIEEEIQKIEGKNYQIPSKKNLKILNSNSKKTTKEKKTKKFNEKAYSLILGKDLMDQTYQKLKDQQQQQVIQPTNMVRPERNFNSNQTSNLNFSSTNKITLPETQINIIPPTNPLEQIQLKQSPKNPNLLSPKRKRKDAGNDEFMSPKQKNLVPSFFLTTKNKPDVESSDEGEIKLLKQQKPSMNEYKKDQPLIQVGNPQEQQKQDIQTDNKKNEISTQKILQENKQIKQVPSLFFTKVLENNQNENEKISNPLTPLIANPILKIDTLFSKESKDQEKSSFQNPQQQSLTSLFATNPESNEKQLFTSVQNELNKKDEKLPTNNSPKNSISLFQNLDSGIQQQSCKLFANLQNQVQFFTIYFIQQPKQEDKKEIQLIGTLIAPFK